MSQGKSNMAAHCTLCTRPEGDVHKLQHFTALVVAPPPSATHTHKQTKKQTNKHTKSTDVLKVMWDLPAENSHETEVAEIRKDFSQTGFCCLPCLSLFPLSISGDVT